MKNSYNIFSITKTKKGQLNPLSKRFKIVKPQITNQTESKRIKTGIREVF